MISRYEEKEVNAGIPLKFVSHLQVPNIVVNRCV